MGLLSKLFGSEAAEKAEKAVSLLKDLADAVNEKGAAKEPQQTSETFKAESVASAGSKEKVPQTKTAAPSGLSWGEIMPAEENQFNFVGSYRQYFEKIFREEFPEYKLDFRTGLGNPNTVITFLDGEREALVVELLSERSDAKAVRRRCEKMGIPYLRYYYDHHGWWNTRSYVVNRTRAALGR